MAPFFHSAQKIALVINQGITAADEDDDLMEVALEAVLEDDDDLEEAAVLEVILDNDVSHCVEHKLKIIFIIRKKRERSK